MTTHSTAEAPYSGTQNALLKSLIAMAVIVAAIAVAVAIDSSSSSSRSDAPGLSSALSDGIGTPLPSYAAGAAVAEHGEFTSLAVRNPSLVIERFAGRDAGLDPDIAVASVPAASDLAMQRFAAAMAQAVPEHGEFTSLAVRNPNLVIERFAGQDAGLDPDVNMTTGLTDQGYGWSVSAFTDDGQEFTIN